MMGKILRVEGGGGEFRMFGGKFCKIRSLKNAIVCDTTLLTEAGLNLLSESFNQSLHSPRLFTVFHLLFEDLTFNRNILGRFSIYNKKNKTLGIIDLGNSHIYQRMGVHARCTSRGEDNLVDLVVLAILTHKGEKKSVCCLRG